MIQSRSRNQLEARSEWPWVPGLEWEERLITEGRESGGGEACTSSARMSTLNTEYRVTGWWSVTSCFVGAGRLHRATNTLVKLLVGGFLEDSSMIDILMRLLALLSFFFCR